jgi:integrase
VRLFLDTGMRLDELAKLRVDDVDLDYDNTATVLGKGRRPPICLFGAQTAEALDASHASEPARTELTSRSSGSA